MELRISRYKLVPKDDDTHLVRLRFFRYRCVPCLYFLSPIYSTPMTDPYNSYDSEEQPYREMFPKLYFDDPVQQKKEEDRRSDRATKIIRFVIGSLLLLFTIVWMFIRFQL